VCYSALALEKALAIFEMLGAEPSVRMSAMLHQVTHVASHDHVSAGVIAALHRGERRGGKPIGCGIFNKTPTQLATPD
jgi:hypothetical protein